MTAPGEHRPAKPLTVGQVPGKVGAVPVSAVLWGLLALGVIAAVILVIVLASHPAPDPTQQWLNCLNKSIYDPSVHCGNAPSAP